MIKLTENCNPEGLAYAVINQAVSDFEKLQKRGALRRDKVLDWPLTESGVPVKIGGMFSPDHINTLYFFREGGEMDSILRMLKADISPDKIRDRLFSGQFECTTEAIRKKVPVDKDGNYAKKTPAVCKEFRYVGIVIPYGSKTEAQESDPRVTEADALVEINSLANRAGYQVLSKDIIHLAEQK